MPAARRRESDAKAGTRPISRGCASAEA